MSSILKPPPIGVPKSECIKKNEEEKSELISEVSWPSFTVFTLMTLAYFIYEESVILSTSSEGLLLILFFVPLLVCSALLLLCIDTIFPKQLKYYGDFLPMGKGSIGYILAIAAGLILYAREASSFQTFCMQSSSERCLAHELLAPETVIYSLCQPLALYLTVRDTSLENTLPCWSASLIIAIITIMSYDAKQSLPLLCVSVMASAGPLILIKVRAIEDDYIHTTPKGEKRVHDESVKKWRMKISNLAHDLKSVSLHQTFT